MRKIPYEQDDLPGWGPTDEELLEVAVEDVVAKTAVEDSKSESEDDEDDDLPIHELEEFEGVGAYHSSGDSRKDWGTYNLDDEWFNST